MKFIIAGEGAYRQFVEHFSQVLKNVTYLGFVSGTRLINFYKQSRVVLVPSIAHECFPTVAVEALAMGRPVIGFALGGVKEIIEESRGGILVKPFDFEELVDKLNVLLVDDDPWEKLSVNGRIWVKYNIPTMKTYVETLVKIYERYL